MDRLDLVEMVFSGALAGELVLVVRESRRSLRDEDSIVVVLIAAVVSVDVNDTLGVVDIVNGIMTTAQLARAVLLHVHELQALCQLLLGCRLILVLLQLLLIVVAFGHLLVLLRDAGHRRHEMVPFGLPADLVLHRVGPTVRCSTESFKDRPASRRQALGHDRTVASLDVVRMNRLVMARPSVPDGF